MKKLIPSGNPTSNDHSPSTNVPIESSRKLLYLCKNSSTELSVNLENYDVNFTLEMSPLDYSCHPTNHPLRCHFMLREENDALKNKTQEETNQHLYLKNKTKQNKKTKKQSTGNNQNATKVSHWGLFAYRRYVTTKMFMALLGLWDPNFLYSLLF